MFIIISLAAKITIFPNISKYLIKYSAFFNFFLEIEEIVGGYATTVCRMAALRDEDFLAVIEI